MGVCLPIVHEGGSRYAFTVTKHTYLGDGTSWGFGARTRAADLNEHISEIWRPRGAMGGMRKMHEGGKRYEDITHVCYVPSRRASS